LLRGGLLTQLGIVKLENETTLERDKLQDLRLK
jgi:hypothetical protein